MRLRPYIPDHDFDKIKDWITDARTNAMWSANHIGFPLEREDFDAALGRMFLKYGDCPFVALTNEGKVTGFICCSVNYESNEAMLAFVVVDPAQRGKGTGKEMVSLAAKYCFEILKADAVQLNVFTANAPARHCYESAGFTERHTDENAFTYGDESWGRCNMILQAEPAPARTLI